MPRPPEWANWPWDHGWQWGASVPQGPSAYPGHVRLIHLESQQYWDIHVLHMDQIAQQHLQNREVKHGQPVKMGDGRVLEVPYKILDDEADFLMSRGMTPHSDRTPIRLQFKDGTVMDKTPRDWFEQLAANHVQRRTQEPPVPLGVAKDKQIMLTYPCIDALCKDFMRRRGDWIAAGKWPELINPFRDVGQHQEGPRPVQGHANALGEGVQVLQGQQPGQEGQVPPSGPAPHPAMENQELV